MALTVGGRDKVNCTSCSCAACGPSSRSPLSRYIHTYIHATVYVQLLRTRRGKRSSVGVDTRGPCSRADGGGRHSPAICKSLQGRPLPPSPKSSLQHCPWTATMANEHAFISLIDPKGASSPWEPERTIGTGPNVRQPPQCWPSPYEQQFCALPISVRHRGAAAG